MRRAVFSLLVENSSGVLSRVSGLFSRRGYNIESLTVGETLDPKYSKMTVAATGDEDVLEQIEKQLAKLTDVREIVELPPDEFYEEYGINEGDGMYLSPEERIAVW